MDNFIKKLNWFYTFEVSQVELYTSQSKQVDDIYVKKTLERLAIIEQNHVVNISKKIELMGGVPTKLGDIIKPITGTIASIMTDKVDLGKILTVNMLLEQKAISDYKKAIEEVKDDPGLYKLLWDNLIDEDLHMAWLSRKANELKEQQNQK